MKSNPIKWLLNLLAVTTFVLSACGGATPTAPTPEPVSASVEIPRPMDIVAKVSEVQPELVCMLEVGTLYNEGDYKNLQYNSGDLTGEKACAKAKGADCQLSLSVLNDGDAVQDRSGTIDEYIFRICSNSRMNNLEDVSVEVVAREFSGTQYSDGIVEIPCPTFLDNSIAEVVPREINLATYRFDSEGFTQGNFIPQVGDQITPAMPRGGGDVLYTIQDTILINGADIFTPAPNQELVRIGYIFPGSFAKYVPNFSEVFTVTSATPNLIVLDNNYVIVNLSKGGLAHIDSQWTVGYSKEWANAEDVFCTGDLGPISGNTYVFRSDHKSYGIHFFVESLDDKGNPIAVSGGYKKMQFASFIEWISFPELYSAYIGSYQVKYFPNSVSDPDGYNLMKLQFTDGGIVLVAPWEAYCMP